VLAISELGHGGPLVRARGGTPSWCGAERRCRARGPGCPLPF
jgi:hypothetical protein